jgi:hypothetical protein
MFQKLKFFMASFKSWFLNKWGKNSFFLGAQRAYIIPTLPLSVENFNNHIFVRILRVLGGISFFIFMLGTRPDFGLQIHNYFKFFVSILASFHITYVIIIFIIRIIYSMYTLISQREKFEVRNSPLNKYASIISNALYCLKFGCAATGAGASFIAGGMAYDSVLVQAGRPHRFLPFLGTVYTGFFGEVPKNLASNRPLLMGGTQLLITKLLKPLQNCCA